jgi:hypothetical protein
LREQVKGHGHIHQRTPFKRATRAPVAHTQRNAPAGWLGRLCGVWWLG